MANFKIPKGDENYVIGGTGGTFVLAKGVTRTAPDGDAVIIEGPGASQNMVMINGTLKAGSEMGGVVMNGQQSGVQVGKTGSITVKTVGIWLLEDNQGVSNLGKITAGDAGIMVREDFNLIINEGRLISKSGVGISVDGDGVGENSYVINNGRIDAAQGIVWANSNNMLVLDTKSDIRADVAIQRTNQPAVESVTVNAGRINAETAFLGGDGDESFLNVGKMTGSVILGAGNDSFENRKGGSYQGTVDGGAGDDTFHIDSDKIKIVELEGEGLDTVFTTVSFKLKADGYVELLYLDGKKNINATGDNSGNDLYGNKGNNILSGLGGDDILIGDAGKDIFVIRDGGDNDWISDFVSGDDRIDVSKWTGFDTFAQVKSAMEEADGGVFIIANDADSVFIANSVIDDFSKSDFIF